MLAAALLATGCGLPFLSAEPDEAALFSVRGGVVTQIGSEPPRRTLFKWSRLAETGGPRDRLTVMSPAGMALFRVERSDSDFRFRDASGQVAEGDQALRMFRHQFGWQLPLDEAAYWIRCKSHPGSSAVERITFRGEVVIEQLGWVVECSNLDPDGRPSNVRMAGEHATLRLEIAEWRN